MVEHTAVQTRHPSHPLASDNAGQSRPTWGMLRAFAVLWALHLPSSIAGQITSTAAIHGRVVADDSTPVIDALVELIGRAQPVRTAATGEFEFDSVAVGGALLRIRAFSFAEKDEHIEVTRDSGWRGTIVLTRVPQPLPEVVVAATSSEYLSAKYLDFFRRRQVGIGTFRTRASMDSMGASDVVGLLRQIPGVTVTATFNPYGQPETRFRIARCPGQPPNLAVYINGLRVTVFGKDSENKGSELSSLFRQHPPSSVCDDCARLAEVLASVPFSQIEFIEFYRGPGQIPADLDRGDSCAALVIWTR
jgi:hypothetical protein